MATELLRQAVEGNQDRIGNEIETRYPGPKGSRQNVDIGAVVEIGRRNPHRRLPAHRFQCFENYVMDASRRGGGVLRIKRQDQDSVQPCSLRVTIPCAMSGLR